MHRHEEYHKHLIKIRLHLCLAGLFSLAFCCLCVPCIFNNPCKPIAHNGNFVSGLIFLLLSLVFFLFCCYYLCHFPKWDNSGGWRQGPDDDSEDDFPPDVPPPSGGINITDEDFDELLDLTSKNQEREPVNV